MLTTIIFTAAIIIAAFFIYRGIHSAVVNFKTIAEKDSTSYTNEVFEPTFFGVDGEIHQATEKVYVFDKIIKGKKDFDKIYANYVPYSQMINILPLLGILGTVVGLTISLSSIDANDLQPLLDGLKTALFTTIAGIVCCVFLKWYDAAKAGVLINQIDSEFEHYEELERHHSATASQN